MRWTHPVRCSQSRLLPDLQIWLDPSMIETRPFGPRSRHKIGLSPTTFEALTQPPKTCQVVVNTKQRHSEKAPRQKILALKFDCGHVHRDRHNPELRIAPRSGLSTRFQ